MTRKEELFAEYAKVKVKVSNITLFIKMPTGETEIISNPRVLEKMAYIYKTYNDNLVHSNCDKIQIENYVFETLEETMDFGSAILNLKERHKVVRKGWNGKEMYITLIPEGNAMYQGYDMQNCIGMKTADNKMQPGWVPSQADMLAEDWIVVM
ncbi:MAG: DUF2829 domain-containing protein [Lacrimispora sphenoides]